MPPILVIDHDGPARAAHEARLKRENPDAFAAPRPGRSAIGATPHDAVIADRHMSETNHLAKVRELMNRHPDALMIALASNGAVAPIHDAPDFNGLADRLSANGAAGPAGPASPNSAAETPDETP